MTFDLLSIRVTGATYLLLNHPDKMEHLVCEIRSAFKSTEDISVHSVHQLEYLAAALEETMRLYPPVAQQAVRLSPTGGGTVDGKFMPAGVSHIYIYTSMLLLIRIQDRPQSPRSRRQPFRNQLSPTRRLRARALAANRRRQVSFRSRRPRCLPAVRSRHAQLHRKEPCVC